MKVTLADKKMVLKRLGKGHEVCNILDEHERKTLRSILQDVNQLAKIKFEKEKTSDCINWQTMGCQSICKGCEKKK